MTSMETHWDIGSIDISRVLDIVVHTRYPMAQEALVVCSSIQEGRQTHNGIQ